jgi:hypothetical protein
MTRHIPAPLRRPSARRARERPPERPAEVISAFVRTLERLGGGVRAPRAGAREGRR